VSNYVSDQVLDRIRQATDIAALVRNIVPLKKSGSGQIGLCPFHKEKTPSFHVNSEKQIFKCFGCGVGGDVFSFVMKTDGVSFMEAVRLLAERAHVELPERDGHAPPPGEKERLYEVNGWAAETFHHWLLRDPAGKAALEYLKKRGLSEKTIKEFKLGFSPDSWDSLVKAASRKKYGGELLRKAGLTATNERSDRSYDRFRNRVIFPIRDAQDRVIGFGGRSLGDEEPKYLNSPETPLFSKGRVLYALDKARAVLREKRCAVVVEGYMDAVMAHQFGVTWTVAVLGTALSQEHVRVLRRHADEAVLLFDSDNAGQSSASRSVDAFAAEEMPVRVATLPGGLDPDEFLLQHGLEAFQEQLDRSPDGVTYKLERALAGTGQTAAGTKALDDVLATVALMPNSTARFQEVRKIATRTGVHEHLLQQRLQSLAAAPQSWSDEAPAQESRPARMDYDRQLLSLMLAYPQTVPLAREQLHIETLNDTAVRALVQRVFALAESSAETGPAELLARTQEEELRAVVEDVMVRSPVAAPPTEAALSPTMTETVYPATTDPAGTFIWLLRQIEARSLKRRADELHRQATQAPTTAPPTEESMSPTMTKPDWNAGLLARRKEHRTRGTFDVQRDSNGGTG
jgi:DNA primase